MAVPKPVSAELLLQQERVGPCVAVMGKSNVGKSSLINNLLGQRSARRGKTPGLTEHIFAYGLPQNKPFLYLLDFPGIGFAQGGAKREARLRKLMSQFLARYAGRLHMGIFLHDGRRAAELYGKGQRASTHESLETEWLAELFGYQLPVLLVLTKVDKLSRKELDRAAQGAAAYYEVASEDLFLVSNKERKGIDELRSFLLEQSGETLS